MRLKMSQEIAEMYRESLERECTSRATLRAAVSAIENAKGGRYDGPAMAAEEAARRVLANSNNGLSPSEEAMWGDRVRNAYRTQAYFQK